jgi:hypothetical protein
VTVPPGEAADGCCAEEARPNADAAAIRTKEGTLANGMVPHLTSILYPHNKKSPRPLKPPCAFFIDFIPTFQ